MYLYKVKAMGLGAITSGGYADPNLFPSSSSLVVNASTLRSTMPITVNPSPVSNVSTALPVDNTTPTLTPYQAPANTVPVTTTPTTTTQATPTTPTTTTQATPTTPTTYYFYDANGVLQSTTDPTSIPTTTPYSTTPATLAAPSSIATFSWTQFLSDNATTIITYAAITVGGIIIIKKLMSWSKRKR